MKKNEQETQVLFELIAHRYETGSLIVTSNQPPTVRIDVASPWGVLCKHGA